MAPVLVLNNGKIQHSITCFEHFPDDDDDDDDVFVTRMNKVFVSPDFLIKRKKTFRSQVKCISTYSVCLCVLYTLTD